MVTQPLKPLNPFPIDALPEQGPIAATLSGSADGEDLADGNNSLRREAPQNFQPVSMFTLTARLVHNPPADRHPQAFVFPGEFTARARPSLCTAVAPPALAISLFYVFDFQPPRGSL